MQAALAQQAFIHISTQDGMGLSSNTINTIYQDKKGFIWVGTSNGLQRFDGSKFVQFSTGLEAIPYSSLTQIIQLDSNCLFLSFPTIKEFGIFNTSKSTYKKVGLKTSMELRPRTDPFIWKASDGELYLDLHRYGVLHYSKKENAFIEDNPFPFPKGWGQGLYATTFEDVVKKQYWFSGDSGICIYNKPTHEVWTRNYNPQHIAILNNSKVQDKITELYIDKKRRIWVCGWPGIGGQVRYCLDSNGNYLNKDTIGLNTGPVGYSEYRRFYETRKADFWISGLGVLYKYDKKDQRFNYIKSNLSIDNIGINYDYVFQVMEDNDGAIWLATDRGLYFTSVASSSYAVINILFDNSKSTTSITDILEMPNGNFWFTSWGQGVKSLDKNFNTVANHVYDQKPKKKDSVAFLEGVSKMTWCMQRQSSTGSIFIGCNFGVLLVHNPTKNTTEYLRPAIFNNSTIRYITEDKQGQLWFGTQGGRLIKYSNNQFTLVQEIGSIIYKVFIDNQGWLWLATHEKGFFAIDQNTGKVLQHYTAGKERNNLYTNTAFDIEQLNDSIIVVGAGALNFVNKKRQTIRLLKYEDGLPSNTVERLRVDKKGFLWIITANGLSRYNPLTNAITFYGSKDGIISAEQAKSADYVSSQGLLMFAGSNALVVFHPSIFANTQLPPNVTITDFKLFNTYLPVDSLLGSGAVKLRNDQNSFSLYYAALSFMQHDKLSYYYKMEGIDKDWIKADKSLYINYSLLPPGKYTFKIYAENIEGMRSQNITEIIVHIKPPFWRTYWFLSVLLLLTALAIYSVYTMKVNKLLAVEKIRTRVARDLHDDMGSTLSTINILTAMAKNKMSTDAVRTAEYLGKIGDNSQRMMEAMDDIVWSIKPSNDSMQKVTARMREFATNVLEAKDMDIKFNIAEDVLDIKLNMEARRDFFLVFKEAVNNAAKYSKAETVWIDISVQNRKLILCVKDNGVGFTADNADNGNGIGNMKKRADGINGRLDIHSKEGEGTKIRLSVPLG